ncbi:unnamed protein product [Caenorhabditis angaria]|uniref:Ig-like domain-containing protein n=1 Tax=Caenorhabditis angaria TaxID=860376 RepID=A0A9P1IMI9_9PELO|nr:unnamed protein product [Caenorhabditis angaria]
MKWFSILLSIIIIIAPILAVTRNAELAQEYKKYRECLERLEKEVGDSKKIQVVQVVKGADVVLPCFSCVSPEDGIEIDSTYKPSSGIVGRNLNAAIDFFKKVLMKSSHIIIDDKDQWKYDWEFAKTSQETGFRTLSSMHFSISAAISDRIKRFQSKDESEFKLGDRYELVLKNVNGGSNGFYRCKNSHRRNIISNMYYLEVINKKTIDILSSNSSSNSISMKSGKIENEIEYEIGKSLWNECSMCSSIHGEKLRIHQCFIKIPSKPADIQNKYPIFELFDKIPCTSTLVPLNLRKQLRNLGLNKIYIEVEKCLKTCPNLESELAQVTQKSQLGGEFRVLDYVPAGEFVFGDILPRLLPPVIRRVQIVLENDPLVISCQNEEHSGIYWISMKKGLLKIANVSKIYEGRAYFDEKVNLIFDQFSMDDEDEFFCYSSTNILLGTFHMRVIENDKNQQIIEIVQIFVKFAAFILVFSLIASQLFE